MNISLDLGLSAKKGKPMSWTSTVNAHLNISGQSGQRKTTLLRSLICQLAGQNVHVVVLDSAGDFSSKDEVYPAGWQELNKRIVNVLDPQAPVSSMTPWLLPSGNKESLRQFADRISGTLKGALRSGDKQWAYLNKVITEDFDDMGSTSMRSILGHIEEDALEFSEARSLQTRLAILADFPETDPTCYEAFNTSGITIIDTQDIRSTSLRSIVAEMILGNLWGFKLAHKGSCPMIVVLDECQHLRFDGNSMAHTILREGRKYDLAGWFSSQWIKQGDATTALGQAALQIFFRPDDLSIDRTAKRLTHSNPRYQLACKRELVGLEPGHFFILKDGRPVEVDGNCEVHKDTDNEPCMEVQ